ncbi:MAG: DUF2254 domain-containing protein [Gemmatimonadota bacterium]|nr:DUF2254 domain-containing protein [Gemmatimonadota bacterium]
MRVKRFASRVRESFWFVPSVIVGMSILLAISLIAIDAPGPKAWMARWPRLFGAGAEGARGMLSTIAGSMMTVVGVTFSMTLVVLALASSQYTSRILRNFMRDRVTQVVLGIFAGIYVYCLIVLRTIRNADEGGFVPSLSVLCGVILAIGGISVLIFFIHHIASSIQASTIIASVADETVAAVDRLFPDRLGHGLADYDAEQLPVPLPECQWQAVRARRSGYIQSVDNAALLGVARDHQTVVRMERGIGEFIVRDTTLASLAMAQPPAPAVMAALRSAYGIHHHRTVEQDVGFGIRQIVDMALRALSPGINDTTTAVMCVDYLTTILARLASRPIPSSRRHENGELRVIARGPTFASVVDEAFDQIRSSAPGNAAVMMRMLDAVQIIDRMTVSDNRRDVLRQHVSRIAELAARTIASPSDGARLDRSLSRVRGALGGASAGDPHGGQ